VNKKRYYHDAYYVATAVGEKAHHGTKQHRAVKKNQEFKPVALSIVA